MRLSAKDKREILVDLAARRFIKKVERKIMDSCGYEVTVTYDDEYDDDYDNNDDFCFYKKIPDELVKNRYFQKFLQKLNKKGYTYKIDKDVYFIVSWKE